MNDKAAFATNPINSHSDLMKETERRKPSNNAGPPSLLATSS